MSIDYVVTALDQTGAPELVAIASSADEAIELIQSHTSPIGDAAQKVGTFALTKKIYDAAEAVRQAERARRVCDAPKKIAATFAGVTVWIQAR